VVIVPGWDRTFDRAFAAGGWDATLAEAALAHCRAALRCAVDVGAHVGAWTMRLAAEFEHVWAIEPCAENLACLRQNVAALPNVTIVAAAAGAEEGEATLGLPAEPELNSGMRTLGQAGETVPVFPLDRLDLPRLDLLKIDVEGFELPVLLGARTLLRRHRPVIVLEENGRERLHRLPRRGARAALLGLGYRVAAVFPDNLLMVPE
jgi:FkbM family methyltransferase